MTFVARPAGHVVGSLETVRYTLWTWFEGYWLVVSLYH